MSDTNQIPDDRNYYNAELDSECDGEDWKQCPCDECQGRRDDYADMLYERRRDEEFDK